MYFRNHRLLRKRDKEKKENKLPDAVYDVRLSSIAKTIPSKRKAGKD